MSHEVVVVGAGIGGLTAAALLAARGVDVCVLEREPGPGGSIMATEKFGYTFEASASLYASWQPGEIHERVFAELPVPAPGVRLLAPAYVVRLPDDTQIPVTENDEEFEAMLRRSFPECAASAINFYRALSPVHDALRRVARRLPDLRTASTMRKILASASEAQVAARALAFMNYTTARRLGAVSSRFRRFIDVQLQMFAQCSSEVCGYLYAAVALTLPRQGMYEFEGGAAALAAALADAIRKSGGTIRYHTPVLRLAYDAPDHARGVDLLSGETVTATRAVLSNLSVWDTYGRLIGPDHTPDEIRRRLKSLRGWGAYCIFLGLDEETAARLPAARILALTDWQEGQSYDPEQAQFMLSVAPPSERRAPPGKRAVTISTFTEPSQWFAFHEDENQHETQDQEMLERCWERIDKAIPELGNGIEIIETLTPRSFYDRTRRSLGMVGGVGQALDVFGPHSFSHRTSIRNLYLVGDSTFPGNGVAAVTQSALIAANEIAPPGRRRPR